MMWGPALERGLVRLRHAQLVVGEVEKQNVFREATALTVTSSTSRSKHSPPQPSPCTERRGYDESAVRTFGEALRVTLHVDLQRAVEIVEMIDAVPTELDVAQFAAEQAPPPPDYAAWRPPDEDAKAATDS